MENKARNPSRALSKAECLQFFINHLHRIYCAKSQLADKLPLLGDRAHFLDLQQAIAETVEIVRQQLARIQVIYRKLDRTYLPENCVAVNGVLGEAFQSAGTPGESPALRDLSLLFYMQSIESIEIAAFKAMLMVARKLEEPEVEQLLLECYDEAREDKALFTAITQHYV
jgi:ferritin-like metal-binding protein YciE